MDNYNDDKHEKVVDDKDVKIDSFHMYESSDDEDTKIVDGEKVIKSFEFYKEEEN